MPDLTKISPDVLLALGFVGIVFIVGMIALTICAVVLDRRDLLLDAGLKPPRLNTTKRQPKGRTPEQQYAAAFERYADLGRALGAVLEDAGQDKETVARGWFGLLCQGLSGGLSTGTTETFRAAVWMRSSDRELEAIATHLLALRADRRLPMVGSLAGQCITERREVYIADIGKDPTFNMFGDARKVYSSVVAVPCGPREDPWGAITVDAKGQSVFTDVDRELVRRFADLADVGMLAWDSEVTTGNNDATL
jgi:hypothetical protein